MEVHRAHQAMWQGLIQTDREGRNVHFNSLMVHYKKVLFQF